MLQVCKYGHAIMHKRLRLRHVETCIISSKLHSCQTLAAGGLLEALFRIEHTITKSLDKHQNCSCCSWCFWSAPSLDMDYLTVIQYDIYDLMMQCETVARERERERYSMIQYDTVWYSMIQYDTVWYSMIQYDTPQFFQISSRLERLQHRSDCYIQTLLSKLDGASISSLGRDLRMFCSFSLPPEASEIPPIFDIDVLISFDMFCEADLRPAAGSLAPSWHQISTRHHSQRPRYCLWAAGSMSFGSSHTRCGRMGRMGRMAQDSAVKRRKYCK